MNKKLLSLGVVIGLVGCVSKPVNETRTPSAESEYNFVNHPESSGEARLPFDSPFKDRNGDQNIDASEMTKDNLNEVEDPNSVSAKNPIIAVGLKRGELILTIDDGPNANVTPKLLDLFDEYGIKATFFMVGKQVKINQKLVAEMGRRGHTLANHTYDHDIPHITSSTIVKEFMDMHRELVAALGDRQPEGRLLYRTPGLAWSGGKFESMNSDGNARKYIGPIHANLGADEPAADWHCWSHGVSAEACADMYFKQIVNTGRGIILSHDIYYKKGSSNNSYEMWKILLRRLDTEGGGISNRSGDRGAVWTFVNLAERSVLDQYEEGGTISNPNPAQPGSGFSNGGIFLRSEDLASAGNLTDDTKIPINGGFAKTSAVLAYTDLKANITVEGKVFHLVRIDKTAKGYNGLSGVNVYVFEGAF